MVRSPVHAALVAGAALGGIAQAQQGPPDQQEGPVIVGERRDTWRALELHRLELAYEFLGTYQEDRLKQTGQPTVLDRETLLRNLIDFTTELSIGHKNMMDVTGTVQLGLDDRHFDSETVDQTTSEVSTVSLYDVRALFLGNGPLPVTAYARRDENILDRPFAGTIDQVMTEYGVIAQLRSERAPTTVQAFHREEDLSDTFGQTDSTTTQDTVTGQSGIRITENQQLELMGTYDHVHQEQQDGTFSDTFDQYDANIVHTLSFGPQERYHELRSSLHLYDQSGTFSQRETRLDEMLLLRHTDRLETRYDLSADRQSFGDQDQELYRGEASVTHHLFDSLTSRASVGAQRLDTSEGFTSDDEFVTGQLDYTKRAGIGRIDASAGATFNAQQNSERGGALSVINEPHVFNDPFPIVLPRRNIVPGSIEVTAPGGFPTYLEGVDYTVEIFSDRAELTVLAGGAILDGQTVLASYLVGPEPASNIDTTDLTFSLRYTLTEGALTGLSFYSIYRETNHSLDTADPSRIVLDDVNDLVLGVEYIRSGLDLKLQHQWRDSTSDPYNALRAQAIYTQPLGRDSLVNFEYTHESIDYTAQSNRVEFDRLTARWYQRLTSSLEMNLRLEYRNERDKLNGDSEGFDQTLGFTWRRGQTTIYASAQNSFLDGPGSERDSQYLQFGLRRAF